MRANSGAGSGAEPETSSRAARSPSAIDASSAAARPSRWYIVGTPNSMVAPSRSAPAAAAGSKRPRWRSSPPRRSGPNRPITRPWTWNSGSPCASTSSPVQAHAPASASRLEATDAARQDGALGAAGRARGVDHERGILVAGLRGRQVAAARAEVDREPARRMLERRERVAGGADDHVGPAVAEHVLELRAAQLRVDRHERDAGAEGGGRRDAGLQRRLGPHRDALRAAELRGERRGGLAQLAVAEPVPGHGDGWLGVQLVHSGQQRLAHGLLGARLPWPVNAPRATPTSCADGFGGRPES